MGQTRYMKQTPDTYLLCTNKEYVTNLVLFTYMKQLTGKTIFDAELRVKSPEKDGTLDPNMMTAANIASGYSGLTNDKYSCAPESKQIIADTIEGGFSAPPTPAHFLRFAPSASPVPPPPGNPRGHSKRGVPAGAIRLWEWTRETREYSLFLQTQPDWR